MKIVGTGVGMPAQIVTNDMLSEILDTSDEWISTRTGIKRRRLLNEDRLEDISADAAKMALERAGMCVDDMDFIICSNVINNFLTPGLSNVVAEILGAKCPGIDMNGGCTGFIFALHTAQAYLNMGMKNILILCSEAPSMLPDWTDRSTCVLFGDMATAAVVSASEDTFDITFDTKYDKSVLYAVNYRCNNPYGQAQPEAKGLYMDGGEVYKYAVFTAIEGITQMLDKHELSVKDVDKFLLHQANYRIVDAVRKRMGEGEDKFPTNMQNYGNTSSASILLLMHELVCSGDLKKGDRVVISAFGAGLIAGTAMFKWSI